MELIACGYTLLKKGTNWKNRSWTSKSIRRKIQFFAYALERSIIIDGARRLATVQVRLAAPLRRTIAVKEYMPISEEHQ